jgi:N-methylhydantoinase A
MRISVDIGGTFTDLVLETEAGVRLFKAPTIPGDPVQSVIDAVAFAAAAHGRTVADLLGETEMFFHATTRSLNAIVTGTTARTALLVTAGHPDVMVLREGGRPNSFDFTIPYPEPYVPRSLTFEVPERVRSDGAVITPLDEAAVAAICERIKASGVEAVAVCLLWSTINPEHELAVGRVLAERLPDMPVTLSHQLNPTLREYRRASSACIDASLKPIMTDYLHSLEGRLRGAGFNGKLLMVSSVGGVLGVDDVAQAPIHSINSGPSMAPIAGRAYARVEAHSDIVIIADAGGTTYDVTVVASGHIPWTRETWIGPRYVGHMTGFPSIDVKSVGAGGGSIAWVDPGGLLHVGPQSAGSFPGPACYGRGGQAPTVTDAALLLGYLDPGYFADGAMTLDAEAATEVIRRGVAEPLGLGIIEAADAVLRLTTEQMVRAIEDITLEQGIDAAAATLIGGGGAAGLNAIAVAQRLGSRQLLIPMVGAALAAAGALMSDLTGAYAETIPTSSPRFDADKVNAGIARLLARCREFIAKAGVSEADATIELHAEAHYPQQIWELEVPLRVRSFSSAADVAQLVEDFHAEHGRVLGVAQPESGIEIVTWGARVRCALAAGASRDSLPRQAPVPDEAAAHARVRDMYFAGVGTVPAPVRPLATLLPGEVFEGPGVIEAAFTTIVVPPGVRCQRGEAGSLSVVFDAHEHRGHAQREGVRS